jgi:hypothetical protein
MSNTNAPVSKNSKEYTSPITPEGQVGKFDTVD